MSIKSAYIKPLFILLVIVFVATGTAPLYATGTDDSYGTSSSHLLVQNLAASPPESGQIDLRVNVDVTFILVAIIISLTLCGILVNYNSKKTKKMLETLAYVDSLTGISTLAKFRVDSTQLLKSAKPSEYMLVHMDINNFKYINNSYGYNVGDQVLVAIIEHFRENILKGDLLARTSSDNFVILTKALDRQASIARFDHMCTVKDHLIDILPKPRKSILQNRSNLIYCKYEK